MMQRRQVLKSALAYAGAGLLGGAAGAFSRSDPKSPEAIFDEVWRRVGADYFNPPDTELWARTRHVWRPKARAASSVTELYLGVLTPMLETFDRSHLHVQPPKGTRVAIDTRIRIPRPRRGDVFPMFHPSTIAGLGLEPVWDGEAWTADWVAPASVAARVGLVPGDTLWIRSVRGVSPGNDVGQGYAEIRRHEAPNRPIVLLWKNAAPGPSTKASLSSDGTSILRFDGFAEAQIDWLLERLAQVNGRMILDLRRNTGGDLRQLHRVLDALMPAGTHIGEVMHKGRRMTWNAGAPVFLDRLAVLVGLRTQSAAEILADVLKDRAGTVVLGRRTAGAVLGSEIVPLADGGRLTLPTMELRRPGNRQLEGLGVVPDIVSAPRTFNGDLDPQIEDASAALATLG